MRIVEQVGSRAVGETLAQEGHQARPLGDAQVVRGERRPDLETGQLRHVAKVRHCESRTTEREICSLSLTVNTS